MSWPTSIKMGLASCCRSCRRVPGSGPGSWRGARSDKASGWLPAVDPRPGARRLEPRRGRDEYGPYHANLIRPIIPSELLSGARNISAAPGPRKWPVLLLIKMGSLDPFKIGQYPLAWTPTLGLPSFQSRALPKAVQHLALRSEVGLQIASRGRHRGVPQIITNGRQINAGLEQRDGATVAPMPLAA